MAMKKFRIHYQRHGSVATYDHHEDVSAVSEKMALKKFWNYKQFGDTRTRKQWMEYERQVNGIWWSDIRVEQLEG